jgi:uncharacterized membrane protein required for colicin V production
MSALDAITLGYMGIAAVRGARRGVGDEVFRLVRVGTALLAGCGLYETVSNALDAVFGSASAVSDTTGFIASFGGAYLLIRMARRQLVAWVAARVSGFARTVGGALAGALRAGVVVAALMTALHISPVENKAAEESWVGRKVSVIQEDEPLEQEATDKQAD